MLAPASNVQKILLWLIKKKVHIQNMLTNTYTRIVCGLYKQSPPVWKDVAGYNNYSLPGLGSGPSVSAICVLFGFGHTPGQAVQYTTVFGD